MKKTRNTAQPELISSDRLAAYRKRIGTRIIEYLTWILQLAQRPLGEITAAGWENLRYELPAFVSLGGRALVPGPNDARILTERETRDIRKELAAMIEKAVAMAEKVRTGRAAPRAEH